MPTIKDFHEISYGDTIYNSPNGLTRVVFNRDGWVGCSNGFLFDSDISQNIVWQTSGDEFIIVTYEAQLILDSKGFKITYGYPYKEVVTNARNYNIDSSEGRVKVGLSSPDDYAVSVFDARVPLIGGIDSLGEIEPGDLLMFRGDPVLILNEVYISEGLSLNVYLD